MSTTIIILLIIIYYIISRIILIIDDIFVEDKNPCRNYKERQVNGEIQRTKREPEMYTYATPIMGDIAFIYTILKWTAISFTPFSQYLIKKKTEWKTEQILREKLKSLK